MVLSGGILLLLLAAGVLGVRRSRVGPYAVLCMLGIAAYHLVLPVEGELSFGFAGFGLELYRFRGPGQLVGFFLALFGLFFFIYMLGRERGRLFHLLALGHVASALAILFVGDYLSFFIFWELLTVTAVLLIILEGRAVLIKRYFLFQLAGAVALMIGIGISHSVTGSMELAGAVGGTVPAAVPFFLLAIMIKAAVIPFHLWMLETYPRVSRELAILLSAYTTKVGVFSIPMLLPELNLELVGGTLAVVAVFYALKQHRLRNFLSYHIVGQIGYMIAGVGGLSATAGTGGIFQISSGVLYKGLLFMVAAVLSESHRNDDIIAMRGRGMRQPLVFVVAVVGAASISGFPPFNGYISKMLLDLGTRTAGVGWLLTLASLGTALSFSKFLYYCFLGSEDGGRAGIIGRTGGGEGLPPGEEVRLPRRGEGTVNGTGGERGGEGTGARVVDGAGGEDGGRGPAAVPQKVAMLGLAASCILMGLFPGPLLEALGGMAVDHPFYTFDNLLKGSLPGFIAVLLFAFLFAPINRAIVRLVPEGFGLTEWVEGIIGGGLDRLQEFHSGHVQHYLLWVFGMLAFIWIYVVVLH